MVRERDQFMSRNKEILYNCPVCNKSGLPDYKNMEAVCPQCESNLFPYMKINLIKKQYYVRNWLITGLFTVVSVLFIYYFTNEFTIDQNNEKAINYKKGMPDLKSNKKNEEFTIYYTVRKNDNLIKISEIFYNKKSNYHKIAADNKIYPPYFINAGQSLIIKYQTK